LYELHAWGQSQIDMDKEELLKKQESEKIQSQK
jgi:hypothetical protein